MYLKFDFESIKQRIINYLSSKEEWATFLDYSVIVHLAESIATELAYDITYGDKKTIENWWSKATSLSSLLVQSSTHGYKCNRKIGAQGTIRFSIDPNFAASYSSDIKIPKFTVVSGGGFYFATVTDIILETNKNYVDVDVIEGNLENFDFVALGEPKESKYIEDDSVENSMFRVLVGDENKEEWIEKDSLFEEDADAKVYQLNLKPTLKGVTIKFGDNNKGKQLDEGTKVTITYLSTHAEECNISSINIVTKVESQIYDELNQPVTLYCTNVSAINNGKNYPDIEEVRYYSPKYYKAGQRATSKEDYEVLIREDNDNILKVSVWGPYENLKDSGKSIFTPIRDEDRFISIACLNNNLSELTNEEKEIVIENLHKKCDPTNMIKFIDTTFKPFSVYVDSRIKVGTNKSEISNNIRQLLNNSYSKRVSNYGESIYVSDIISEIEDVDGVVNSNISVRPYTYATLESYDTGSFILPFENINYKSLKLYVKKNSEIDYTLAATCTDEGILEDAGEGTYIVTGAINKNSKIGSFNIWGVDFDDWNNYTIKVECECDLIGDRKSIWFVENININLNYIL